MSDRGEWTPEKPVTLEVEEICYKERAAIEEKIGKHFDVYTPISFICRMLMGGTTYVVKVQVGVDVYFHAVIVMIINNDEMPMAVEEVLYPKKLSDPLLPIVTNYIQKTVSNLTTDTQ